MKIHGSVTVIFISFIHGSNIQVILRLILENRFHFIIFPFINMEEVIFPFINREKVIFSTIHIKVYFLSAKSGRKVYFLS